MTGILPQLAPEFQDILNRHADRLDLPLINRALEVSASAHRGQKRMSGEEFISHSIAVASILTELLQDSTSIAAALRVHAESLRSKRMQKAEEAAAKTTVKMLFPLIFFIFPSIFVVLVGPAVFLFRDFFGGLQ